MNKLLHVFTLLLFSIMVVGQNKMPISKPLVSHIFTADPSAHVFDGKIYIYPSHDIESPTAKKEDGGMFDMKDFHVLSMNSPQSEVKDNGVALDIQDVKWANRQMWAPDAA